MRSAKEYKIDWDNDAIYNFTLKGKGRVWLKPRDVGGLVPGVSVRYTIKKNKKVFQYNFRFKNKFYTCDLGTFSDEFQIEECQKLHKYITKEAKKLNSNPKNFLKVEKIEISNQITLKEAIEKIIENSFPRKNLTGNLDKKSQISYARFLMGNNERFDKLKFGSTEKGWGTITLVDPIKSWDDLWKKYPPGVGCNGKYKSLYDSTLALMPIREITSYELNQYLLGLDLAHGTKKNFLTSYTTLYHFAKKQGLLGKPIPTNPVKDIVLEIPEETISTVSQYNNDIYDIETLRAIDSDCVKHAKSEPYQSEAKMMCIASRSRIEEVTKYRWDYIKKNEDGYYIEIPRYCAKGRGRAKQSNEIIHITKAIERVLDRVKRQNKRRGHAKYRLIPYIFPSTVCSYEKLRNPGEYPGYASSEECRITNVSIRNSFNKTKERLGINYGSLKTLRKSHITHANRILGGEHIARHYTGHKTKWVIVKHYDKAKQIEIKQMSDKVSKIMFNK